MTLNDDGVGCSAGSVVMIYSMPEDFQLTASVVPDVPNDSGAPRGAAALVQVHTGDATPSLLRIQDLPDPVAAILQMRLHLAVGRLSDRAGERRIEVREFGAHHRTRFTGQRRIELRPHRRPGIPAAVRRPSHSASH